MVHNPRSNLKLASGVAPVPDMLRAGVLVAPRHRWSREQQRAQPARRRSRRRRLFTRVCGSILWRSLRRRALEMATIGGARARSSFDHLGGSLRAG